MLIYVTTLCSSLAQKPHLGLVVIFPIIVLCFRLKFHDKAPIRKLCQTACSLALAEFVCFSFSSAYLSLKNDSQQASYRLSHEPSSPAKHSLLIGTLDVRYKKKTALLIEIAPQQS